MSIPESDHDQHLRATSSVAWTRRQTSISGLWPACKPKGRLKRSAELQLAREQESRAVSERSARACRVGVD